MRLRAPSLSAALPLLLVLLAHAPVRAEEGSVLLATTTSVHDSGLLEVLLRRFTKETHIQVRVVAVGSGAALRMGAEGNADLLLTHAPAGERELVESGAVVARTPFMENHFVIAGPPEDPALVRKATSPEGAFRRIAGGNHPYASRDDDSGTHRREQALLEAAGVAPWTGFLRTGSGMGQTLQVAGERRAYVLSDLGTFLAFQKRIELEALSKAADSLRNVYSVLRPNPKRFPRVRAAPAGQLETFLLAPETAEQIASFGYERFGQALFRPLRLEAAAEAP